MDSEHTSGNSTLIQAAGGLLWRNTAGGLLLAVVHRSRYEEETGTLPKGKLNPGESWLEAAMREVKEETGYQPRVLGFAGAIAYVVAKGPKIVRFWNMTPGSTDQSGLDETEVTSVAWLSPAEAIRQLSYPLERVMVETWQDQISPSLRA